MMLSYLVLIFVFVGYLVYAYQQKRRNISSIPGLNPVSKKDGNVPDIVQAGSFHKFLVELHERFGPVSSFWLGQNYIVSTASVESFKSQMHLFNRAGIFFDLFKPLIGDTSIQFLNDDVGRQARLKFDKYFSFEYCSKYVPTFVDIGKGLAKQWHTSSIRRSPIPLRKFMMEAALQAIGLTNFGKYFGDEQKRSAFFEAYDFVWLELHAQSVEPALDPDGPRIINTKRVLNTLKAQVKEVIEQRSVQDIDFSNKLLIDEIIEHFENDTDVMNTVITFLVGGFHTTGNLLVWIIYFLLNNVDCYEKVVDELNKVCGDEDLWPSAVNDLKYTRQVIDETMRITGYGNFASRISSTELILDGHLIPANTPIVASIGSVCGNEKYWKDPKKFNPNRFDSSERIDILKCPQFGFAGKRKCPGYRFAYFEVYALLSVLLRRFKITLHDPNQIINYNYVLVCTPSEEIFVDVEPI